MKILIPWLIFTVPAFIILHKKNRGFGYYLLSVLFPWIGIIVAACLSRRESRAEIAARKGLK